MDATGDQAILLKNGGSRNFSLYYDLGQAHDLSGAVMLNLSYLSAPTSSWNVQFAAVAGFPLTSNALPAVLAQSVVVTGDTDGPVMAGLTEVVPGSLNAVRYLSVKVTRDGNSAGNSNTSFTPNEFRFSGNISAVPEPATMTLLGLSLVGGFVAHRRQNRKVEAAEVV